MSRVSFSDGFQYGIEVDDVIQRDRTEFYKRKIIKISNVTGAILTISTKEMLQKLEAILPNTKIESIDINGNIGYIFLRDPLQSYHIIKSYSTLTIDTDTYSLSYMTPDSMLFFGNLPLSYQTRELAKLAASYGVISRCLVVHSKLSRKSKGYGFVEYSNRNNAMQAKLHLGAKYLEGRSLRVDWSDERMREYDDTHATTLFVDKLPRHFLQDSVLNAMFQKHGKVIFCQIATSSSTGISRGFAFIDMANAIDAENALNACNNSVIDGTQVRVSYAMPGRPGASILHPKRPDSVGNLLTSFGMTQLPVLNFAQLLASHGAPLMPAQLTALMSALQNYNETSSNTVRINSEPGHHCVISSQDNHSPTLHTSTIHSIQLNENSNNNSSNIITQSFGQNMEESNDEYSNEVEYPMVYQHDAKYYSSTDIQEYPFHVCEDNIVSSDGNTQTYPPNEWSNSQQFPIKGIYEDNCYLLESDSKSYYIYANEEYTYGHSAAVNQPIQAKTSVNSTNLQSVMNPNLSLNKKSPVANAKSYSIWGQHDQGLVLQDIFKRTSICNPIHE